MFFGNVQVVLCDIQPRPQIGAGVVVVMIIRLRTGHRYTLQKQNTSAVLTQRCHYITTGYRRGLSFSGGAFGSAGIWASSFMFPKYITLGWVSP